ncbi:MAG: NADH-quinone oxidoreductase subunit N [Verrucomicrobiota bacterium]
MNSYLKLLNLAAPEAIITLTALLVLGAHILLSGQGKNTRIECTFLSVTGILGTILLLMFHPQHDTFSLFNGMLVVDPLCRLFKIICLVMALLTVLMIHDDFFGAHTGEYFALLLFATVGLMLLVGSQELLMIFIGLELTGLSLYVMTGFQKSDRKSAEAGLKYFLFGSIASAFTLFGLSLIYGMCGTTGLVSISQTLSIGPVQPLLVAGLVMTLVGFAFKIAAAPFHLWAPDAYQGGPITSATFIASGSKVASFFVLGKILLTGFGPLQAHWTPLLAFLAAASIIVGNFAALAQSSVRRLLAYSAVAHAGYTLIGLAAGGRDGFAATLFYTTIYALTIIGAFGVVSVVMRETGGDDIVNFTGLRARSPFLAGCMTIFLLSLAGLPPLVGFFGKFYLFAVAMRQPNLLWLVAVALAGSLVSLYYYLAVLKAVMVDPSAVKLPTIHIPAVQRRVLLIIAVSVLMLGVFPKALLIHILAALPR